VTGARRCSIGHDIVCGEGQPLLVIAGPCQVEDTPMMLELAAELNEICRGYGVRYIFKASADKANRSSASGVRGPGFAAGLEHLAAIRDAGYVTTTDIHESHQAALAATVVDLLQIPALLCRQTDLLRAAVATGLPVNVKKGQFLAPSEMVNVAGKLEGASGIILTERGTTFGYGNLVIDFRGLEEMRNIGHPICFDGTHTVQLPGGLGDRSGGDRTLVPSLVRAAVAVGVDALFLEVHPDPDSAPSDGPSMLTPRMFSDLLHDVVALRAALPRSE
jgi:2-dehydro-3-deoxyphosphooctonate aldolase (KDO 8-P synthase)